MLSFLPKYEFCYPFIINQIHYFYINTVNTVSVIRFVSVIPLNLN